MKKNNQNEQAKKASSDYGAKAIKVLEGLAAVRKRPAMYIGSTNIAGLHHLVYEVGDNSVDEALAGHCDHIKFVLYEDGACSVEDNGRGIPVDIHPTEKVSAAQVVLTKLHAGGKFEKDSYRYSGGLHGVGVSVVNALSKALEIRIFRDGKEYQQFYKKGGVPEAPLKEIGTTDKRGTFVKFYPDPEIFDSVDFNFDTLSSRLRELAFLNKGLKIDIKDERTDDEHLFFYEGGIASFIKHLNAKKNPIFPEVIEFSKDDGTYIVDFACQYNDGYSEQFFSFVNNIRTGEGGTHEAGFRSALTKSCNRYAQKHKILKDGGSLSSDDVREGLVGVLSIKVPEPQFEGQTKTKLGNSEVKGVVDSWLYSFLETFFEENPAIAKKILQKAMLAQQARTAAKKAREITRRKTVLESSILPGKLADCSDTDPEKTELYIVEGDSAGGCFSGDTQVALLDGRKLSFEELVGEHNKGIKNYCYTITKDGNVDIALVKNPRKTKTNANVIKVVLDNDEEIICTPDHLFMLRDGSYKKAEELTKNDSLMPHLKISKVSGIKSITKLNNKIDVYDLEVEDTHNFALANGVFVHNSAKQARDRFTQAILPLKGKILNVEKARLDKMLSNNEIKDLITAIGAGIGNQEFNPEKVRYHKVIIMTDADVDGSHIRILLLTLFFRYMKPLIEKGYLYVAQPPLYKIKVGKTGKYLKDDSELKQFLFDWMQENAVLKVDSQTFANEDWKKLLDNVLIYEKELGKYCNQHELALVHGNELIKFLNDIEWEPNKFTMEEIVEKLTAYFSEYEISGIREENLEGEMALEESPRAKAYLTFKQLKRTWEVPVSLFKAQETKKVISIYEPLAALEKTDWLFSLNDKNIEKTGKGILTLSDVVVSTGKSFMTVQRYKGLGEMNPEQLWETTMDPAVRRFLQVTIEDGLKADQWFTSLMGDDVCDRRAYIEKHAHFVKNLDI